MDQLRKAWTWLVRHHFWVLIVVATVVAIGCWYSGATTLAQQFKDNKSKIDAQFSAISNLRSTPFKPNQEVNDKQQEQIDIQQREVRALWHELYDRQRAEVLKWPANLSEQFRKHVEGLKFGDTIPVDLRNHYNNYVRDHFPELPKIVGAVVAPEGDGVGGGRGGYSPRGRMGRGEFTGGEMAGDPNATVEEVDYLVEWVDQDLVRQQLYMPTTPSSKRIWKTQEDLWVYEALLKIIAATNKAKGADRFSTAAVRVIESLEVGQPAAQQSRTRNRIEILTGAAPAGGEFGGEFGGGGGGEFGGRGGMGGYGGEMGGGGYGGDMGGEFGGRGGMSMGMGAEGDVDLFANRYIDASGLPMATAPELTSEFKRLPIRLRLWMDERWLPQLIAECANAPLQVDVQEVRINPNDSGSTSGFGGRGMSMSGQGEAMVPEAEPSMKTVIIQGIIYIFNPPTEQTADAGQVVGF